MRRTCERSAWEMSAAIWSTIRTEARRLAPSAQRASRIAPAASSRQRWRSRIASSCESRRAVIVSATLVLVLLLARVIALSHFRVTRGEAAYLPSWSID